MKRVIRGIALSAVTILVLGIGAQGILALDGAGGDGSEKSDVSAQNDIAPFTTVFNTDVAYAGLGGMRGLGSGNITLSGVSGTVTMALLYWHGPTNSSDPAANATVSFAGQSVVGSNIGLSSDNCWGFNNSQAYQADVTSLVTGNASYALANFTKAGVEINGAELIVFFDDGDSTNNRDVVLFDGNDSNTPNAFDANGWNVTLAGINYNGGPASMDLVVSDGQTFSDDAIVVNGTTIAPTGAIFQGDTVPSAGNDNSGLLWDKKSFDVASLLTVGPNTVTLTTGFNDDCLSLIVAAVNLPAGSAPNQPEAPEAIVITPNFTG